MTARKAPEDLKIRPQYDMSVKPRRKKSPEAKAKNIAALRASGSRSVSQSNEAAESANPDRPLTEKQKRFVEEWAKGETILSASYRAGYADGGAIAYKMARDPAILKIYNFEKAKYEEASQMTRKRVMEGILDGIEMAKQVSEPASVINGWKTVGQMCGYFEPVRKKIDISINGNVTVRKLEAMSDADLLKLVKGEVEDVVFEEIAGDDHDS
jgi:hypothetical protein